MALEKVPQQLLNTTGEDCFMSCLGMSLAHFQMLGSLTLEDIVSDLERPGEEFTPMHRTFSWLANRGLRTSYVESLDLSNQSNLAFIDEINRAGARYIHKSPTAKTIINQIDRGSVVLTQLSYSEETDAELDHVVYVTSIDDYQTQVLDPDFQNPLVLPDLSNFWQNRPNMIVIDKMSR
jgi:hypothetical protein